MIPWLNEVVKIEHVNESPVSRGTSEFLNETFNQVKVSLKWDCEDDG